MTLSKFYPLRYSFYESHFLYNLRIFLSLAGAVLLPLSFSQGALSIPLILGVVAGGIADLDDSISGRLKNIIITLACFFIASASVELLFPYPWLFALGLVCSTASFVLLGALGQKYATIAFGALLVAIYTMLNYDPNGLWYVNPLLLILGALWYNILSLIFNLLWPSHPLQKSLSACFNHLASFLEAKSGFFDPDEEDNFEQQKLKLAMENKALIETLDATKTSLMRRLKGDRGQRKTRKMLAYYFMAQEIYARAASTHVQYQKLSQQLKYSDILFRLQRLLMQQAIACQQISDLLLFGQPYKHNPYFARSFDRLDEAITFLKTISPENSALIPSLSSLYKNLKSIDVLLFELDKQAKVPLNTNIKQLRLLSPDSKIGGLSGIYQKIKQNITLESPLFRHAVRMSTIALTGYLIIQLIAWVGPLLISGFTRSNTSFWIIMTSIFVCQPNYNATKERLKKRLWGTLLGVVSTIILLKLGLSEITQFIIIIVAATLFLSLRRARYAYATAFITIMALFCFHFLSSNFVGPERIVDTLLGCLIAWLAVTYIWPDWQFRKISVVVNKMIDADCRYLNVVKQQYKEGKQDNLDYLLARDGANSAYADMASLFSNISTEPKVNQEDLDTVFRLVGLNNTFLGYISALGAHREKIEEAKIIELFEDSVKSITQSLKESSLNIEANPHPTIQKMLRERSTEPQSAEITLLQQLDLIFELLPKLRQSLIDVEQAENAYLQNKETTIKKDQSI